MVEAITWVFNRSTSRKFDRLVLLTLANHLNKETFTAWPKITTLAKEAGICETRVKDSLQSLELLGELSSTARFEKGAPTSNEYRLPRFEIWFQEHCRLTSNDTSGVGRTATQVGPRATQGGSRGGYNPVIEPIQGKIKNGARIGKGPEGKMPTKYDRLIEELKNGMPDHTKENVMRAKNILRQDGAFTAEERELARLWLLLKQAKVQVGSESA